MITMINRLLIRIVLLLTLSIGVLTDLYYLNPVDNQICGPFSISQMRQWVTDGYFHDDLPVSSTPVGSFFVPLRSYFGTDDGSMLPEEQTQFLIQSNEFSQDVRYDQSYPSARVGLNDDQYQRQNSPRGGKRGRILNIVSKFSARKTLGSLSSKLKNKFRSKDDPRKVFDRQSSIARTKKRSMQDQNLYFKDDHWDPSCSSDVQGGQKTQDLRPSDSGSSTDYDYDAPNDSFSNENNQNWLQESAVESTDPQLHERDSTVTYQQEPTFAQSHEIDMKREETVPAKDNLPWVSIPGKSFFPRRVRAAIRVMTLSLRGSFLSSVLILLFQPLFTLLPSGLLFLSMQFGLESFTDTSNLCTFDSGNPWKRVCANRFNQCVSQEFQPEPGPQHILVTKIYNLLHSLNACILSLKKVIPVPLQAVLDTFLQFIWWFSAQSFTVQLFLCVFYSYLFSKYFIISPLQNVHSLGIAKVYRRDKGCQKEDALVVGRASTGFLISVVSSFWIFVVSSLVAFFIHSVFGKLAAVPLTAISVYTVLEILCGCSFPLILPRSFFRTLVTLLIAVSLMTSTVKSSLLSLSYSKGIVNSLSSWSVIGKSSFLQNKYEKYIYSVCTIYFEGLIPIVIWFYATSVFDAMTKCALDLEAIFQREEGLVF